LIGRQLDYSSGPCCLVTPGPTLCYFPEPHNPNLYRLVVAARRIILCEAQLTPSLKLIILTSPPLYNHIRRSP